MNLKDRMKKISELSARGFEKSIKPNISPNEITELFETINLLATRSSDFLDSNADKINKLAKGV